MTELSGKRVVIAGGSGFLGYSLATYLDALGVEIAVLSRSQPKKLGPGKHLVWDGRSVGNWAMAVDGADALINLAGRTVNCIKTPNHQDEIMRSRVESTLVLGQALELAKSPPPVWVRWQSWERYAGNVVDPRNRPQPYILPCNYGRVYFGSLHCLGPESCFASGIHAQLAACDWNANRASGI
jgi:hypothetical protein